MLSDADQLLQALDTGQRAGDGGALDATRVLALGDALALPEPRVTALVGQLQDAGLVDLRWGGMVQVSERGRAHLRELAGGPAGGRVVNAVFHGPATGVNFGDGARMTFSTGDQSPVQGGDQSTLEQTAPQQAARRGEGVAALAAALADLSAVLPAAPAEEQAAGKELAAAVRDAIAAARAAPPVAPATPAAQPGAPTHATAEPAEAPAGTSADGSRSALGRAIDRVTDLCGRLDAMGEKMAKLAPFLPPIAAAARAAGRLAGLPIPSAGRVAAAAPRPPTRPPHAPRWTGRECRRRALDPFGIGVSTHS